MAPRFGYLRTVLEFSHYWIDLVAICSVVRTADYSMNNILMLYAKIIITHSDTDLLEVFSIYSDRVMHIHTFNSYFRS